MDCHKAQSLIDLRMQEGEEHPDWSELDAHLKDCPKCSADWRSQRRVRGLLHAVDADAPTREEIDTMWTAIQRADIAAAPFRKQTPKPRTVLRRVLFPAAGIAAAFLIVVTAINSLGTRVNDTFSEVTGNIDGFHSGSSGLSRARSPSPRRSAKTPPRMAGQLNERFRQPSPPPAKSASVSSLLAESSPPRMAFAAAPELDFGQPYVRSLRDSGADNAPHEEKTMDDGRIAGRYAADQDAGEGTKASPPPQVARPNAKIIKTGRIEAEVDVYEKAYTQVEEIVGRFGGYVADVNTQEREGGAVLGTVVIRVSPERFDALFAALKSVGHLEKEDVKATDVTAQYVDLEARIHSLSLTEERLQELVKNKSIIDKISSLLEVERELTRVRSQIEQYQGQLRVMADRVGLSTITMLLREPSRTVPSASLSVEVVTVEEAATALSTQLRALDGELISGKTSSRSDGTLVGDYRLRVSLSRFDGLLAAIESLGRVEQRQLTNQQFGDTTAPWADHVKCLVALKLFERSVPLPSGAMILEVKAVETAMKRVNAVLADCNGSITKNSTTRQHDGSTQAELTLSVPAGRFPDLVDSLEPLGRTVGKNVSGVAGRIVGGAANVPRGFSLTLTEQPQEVPQGTMSIEVSDFQAAAELLSTWVAEKDVQVVDSTSNQRTDGTWMGRFQLKIKAGDMESVVAKTEQLGRVLSRQVSGLGLGELSRVDPDALGSLDLSISEKAAITSGPDGATGTIRASVRKGIDGMVYSVGMIVRGLIFMAPWAVVLLVPAWLLVRAWRKRVRSAESPETGS